MHNEVFVNGSKSTLKGAEVAEAANVDSTQFAIN